MIAIFDPSNLFKNNILATDYFNNLEDFTKSDFEKYEVIFINGNLQGKPLQLPYEIIQRLWKFVEHGGTLYGELIYCEDFPSSRLFGFKQEFSLPSPRRLEKLRVAKDNSYCEKGRVLEWNGLFLTGFLVEGEILLEIDIFQETHVSKKSGRYPGLVTRKIGKGRTLYSVFSLFGNEQDWSLRPNWLWNQVFEWLQNDYELPCQRKKPAIHFEDNSVDQTIRNSIDWFINSGIMPKQDGSHGVYENVHSIRGDISTDIRPDCNAHTAFMFYMYSEYSREAKWAKVSENILTYLFDEGYQDTNPASSSYGFWKWFKFPGDKPDQIFTDDNSWVAFILLYLYRKTGNEEYKKRGLMTADALLRTQNKRGLRLECIREGELRSKGISYFQESEECSMNPHFESITHAAFIEAYLVSGNKKFLETAATGTRYLLEHLDEMEFMYSKTAGYSRFLLALASLYKITKEQDFYDGIKMVLSYLSKHQHRLGGIEEADNPKPERYGTEDTGVFISNGEQIADQLYTNNFLAINSWEAWKGTQDEDILIFNEKLTNYLKGVQITSSKKEFNGGWMRAFHLESKEYFGNNGDTGWGAYCIESGWTNALITVGLILRELDESLF